MHPQRVIEGLEVAIREMASDAPFEGPVRVEIGQEDERRHLQARSVG